ncbi:hypothetical protein Psch_01791 [Pelotomaculum schinkii]|uniref:Uncharacterized protein n=1 Tax=Pelotomaculum schinkii TaxID=78350 RepID=A0A4Y7RHD6_9FIRM|nr:hypothetical protein Psch_01791 [Pelotomaculum schinkii]
MNVGQKSLEKSPAGEAGDFFFLQLFFYSCRRSPATASANLAMLAARASSLLSMRTSRYAATAMGNPTLPTACRIKSSGITPHLVSERGGAAPPSYTVDRLCCIGTYPSGQREPFRQ